jgi:hypothetical protein
MTSSTLTTGTSSAGIETPSTASSGTGHLGTESVWLYQRTGRHCWVVAYLDRAGQWRPSSGHPNPEDAASRVHWLNGGHHNAGCVQALERAEAEVDRLEATVDRLSATVTRWKLQVWGRARRPRELQRRMGRR